MVKKPFRKLSILFIAIGLFGFLFYSVINITYASNNQTNPNYSIIIKDIQNGKLITEESGNLYGDELWVPGSEHDGILRISNTSGKPIRIDSLGINVNIKQSKPIYNTDLVENSFLHNMKLTVEKGSLSIFTKTLVDKKSLSELSDDNILGNSINLADQDNMDLRYTMKMASESGEELESVKASVDFTITAAEVE